MGRKDSNGSAASIATFWLFLREFCAESITKPRSYTCKLQLQGGHGCEHG